MYSDLELIAAVGVTALATTTVCKLPDWLDRRRTRQADACTIDRHDGPCQPRYTQEIHNDTPRDPTRPPPGAHR